MLFQACGVDVIPVLQVGENPLEQIEAAHRGLCGKAECEQHLAKILSDALS